MKQGQLVRAVIVGRTNVGKSTLFNRLVGRRDAIVKNLPGVTRDRKSAVCELAGVYLQLTDTGGLDGLMGEDLGPLTVNQAHLAVAEADLILLVVDATAGIVPEDTDAARIVRNTGKPVVLVVNKVDSAQRELHASEFHALGFSQVVAVSAEHSRGIGELVDIILAHMPEGVREAPDETALNLAVIGRPNVGKSSLVNAMLGVERVIVSDIPGTTRDSIDTLFQYHGKLLRIVDTAGIRRAGRIGQDLEQYCVLMARRALQRCDVAVVVIDGIEGLTDGDARIAGEVVEQGKACILAVNKWDALDESVRKSPALVQEYKARLGHVDFAPIITVSAKTGLRVPKILSTAFDVYEEAGRRVATPALNKLLAQIVEHQTPPRLPGGREFKFFYAVQVGVYPPHFVIFGTTSDAPHFSYVRFLKNQLREKFGFTGVPLRLSFRQRSRRRKLPGQRE